MVRAMPVSMPLNIVAPKCVFNLGFGVGVCVASVIAVDAAALMLLVVALCHGAYVKPESKYAGE
jgi:hypothetical protein